MKSENQKLLFDMIHKALPANRALVDIVSELLGISTDAAYRRIRCAKLIDFEEAVLLCKRFKIGLEAFVNVSDKKQITCCYNPLENSTMGSHELDLHELLYDLDNTLSAPNGEIVMSSASLSLFNFLPFQELTFFNLYSLSSSIYSFTDNYDEFINYLDIEGLSKIYAEIVKKYNLIPSTEIWTAGVIDRMLTLICYHYEVGHFDNDNFPVLLCEELLSLLNSLQSWTEKGTKGDNNIPFKFYISEIDFDNSFILFKKEHSMKFTLKLFSINGLTATDERFCKEIENWIYDTVQHSTLISGSSEKVRYMFFNGLKQKIRMVIDKIYQNNLNRWVTVPK